MPADEVAIALLREIKDELAGVRMACSRLAALEKHAIATRESIELLCAHAATLGPALGLEQLRRGALEERIEAWERRIAALECDR